VVSILPSNHLSASATTQLATNIIKCHSNIYRFSICKIIAHRELMKLFTASDINLQLLESFKSGLKTNLFGCTVNDTHHELINVLLWCSQYNDTCNSFGAMLRCIRNCLIDYYHYHHHYHYYYSLTEINTIF